MGKREKAELQIWINSPGLALSAKATRATNAAGRFARTVPLEAPSEALLDADGWTHQEAQGVQFVSRYVFCNSELERILL